MKLTLCIDKKPRSEPSEEIREYQFDIGYPLRSIDDVYDELKIITDDDKKLVGILIRRCYIDKYGVLRKLDEEQQSILGLPEITLFEGDNYVYIKEFTDLNMKIQYLTNSEMNKFFATKMELNSTIQQTMERILFEVSQKADDDEVSAALKLLADEIDLKVKSDEIIASLNAAIKDGKGIISILGNYLIINTDNFKLDEEGKMTATGAKFINGDINTNKDAHVGNNLYVGENIDGNLDMKYLYFSNKTYLRRARVGGGTEALTLNSDFVILKGQVQMDSEPSIDSDKRLKTKIKDINDVSWIDELKVKEYEYKKVKDKKHIGLIAQDYVEKDYSKYFLQKDEKGFYSISYNNITNALIQYCQKLNDRISELERRCNNG